MSAPRAPSSPSARTQFSNPQGLVAFVAKSKNAARLQPDHKLVYKAEWTTPAARLNGVRALVRELAGIAAPRKAA